MVIDPGGMLTSAGQVLLVGGGAPGVDARVAERREKALNWRNGQTPGTAALRA